MLVAPTTPWIAPTAGIIAVSSPAVAQSSGGYSRLGGGGASGGSFGGYGGFDRRPAIGGGGYGRPSATSFSGFGLDSSRGGDRAISRRSSSQALQDYRASQARPAPAPLSTSRRPSAGWDDNAWSTAPLQRRSQPAGWGGGAYAPSYAGSSPRFGAWDAVLAWSLLNSLSRPQSVAFFEDNRDDPRYTQWRADADRAAANDPAVAQKLVELDSLMAQSKAQPASPRLAPSDAGGPMPYSSSSFLGARSWSGCGCFAVVPRRSLVSAQCERTAYRAVQHRAAYRVVRRAGFVSA